MRQDLPPYVSYKAILAALDQLSRNPPARVAIEHLPPASDGYQRLVLDALRFLGFLTPDNIPTPRLLQWASHPEQRSRILREALQHTYPGWPQGKERVATDDLLAVLRPYRCSESVRQKALAFLKQAAEDAHLLEPPCVTPSQTTKRRSPTLPESFHSSQASYRTEDDPCAHLPPVIRDILAELPATLHTWSRPKRQQWLQFFELAIHRYYGTEDEQNE